MKAIFGQNDNEQFLKGCELKRVSISLNDSKSNLVFIFRPKAWSEFKLNRSSSFMILALSTNR